MTKEETFHDAVDSPRFTVQGDMVRDARTELFWSRMAQLSETLLSWPEALEFIREMNRRGDFGFSDWRLPNRRELYSLIDHSASVPALPGGHPFADVWTDRYWTATTFARSPAYAWWVQFSGGRMFFGRKTDDCAVWPVRGAGKVLPATGQRECSGTGGGLIDCDGSGQDGEIRSGKPWPRPRFQERENGIFDHLTGLLWAREADLTRQPVNLREAEEAVRALARRTGEAWRLPGIGELEFLTDCSRADPALPGEHPFSGIREAYWSATESGYDPDWAYCLYLHKGAVGVGYKPRREFHVWPCIGPLR